MSPSERLIAAVAGAVTLLLIGAPLAVAHVTVNPEEAEQGSYAKLTFRVPTERDDASTTKLEVTFPEGQPLASVTVKPHPGWTYKVTKVKLDKPLERGEGSEAITEVVSKITWTAGRGSEIKPGEFDEFDVSGGPLPDDADQMILKAVQTYDNGEAVRWIEVAADGASERPEHPAPILKLVKAEKGAAARTIDASASAPAAGDDDSSTGPIALVVSMAALLLGGGALLSVLRRRRVS